MKRRSFFSRIAGAIAAIAIAPEIAFRAKLPVPAVVDPVPVEFWHQTTRASVCFDREYLEKMNELGLALQKQITLSGDMFSSGQSGNPEP